MPGGTVPAEAVPTEPVPAGTVPAGTVLSEPPEFAAAVAVLAVLLSPPLPGERTNDSA